MAQLYNNNIEIDDLSYDNIHNISCDGCKSAQIYSDRYKCLQCIDYNLCGNCFEEQRQTKEHLTGHAMVHFKLPNELFGQPIRHSNQITLKKINELFIGKQHGIQCNGCKQSIVNVRFKCDTCHNYNLCSRCMEQRITNKNHNNTHPLIVASNENLPKIDISDVRKGDKVGKGGFGEVYKATWISKKRIVACKVILVTPHERDLEDSFRKELDAYVELSGIYILKTLGYGEHMIRNQIKECYLITEFMDRGSLANVIADPNENISLRRKLSMACHVISGMQKLHAHSMVHRDIRPDNILVSSNYTAKIGDMGIAHVFNPGEKQKLMGCLPFMLPEFYRVNGQCDQSLDVFTYGLTLNELFTEKPHQFIKSTKRIKLTEKSPIFADIITQCINDDSSQRPTAAELQDILYKFRRASDKYIQEKHSNYASQTLSTKNSIIVKFYNEFQKQESVAEPTIYLPPPKPHVNSNLIRQHFDDMMTQFNQIDPLDFHRAKDRQRFPHFNKWIKYFDDERIDAISPAFEADVMKIDRRPRRSSSPPPNFLQVPGEHRQHIFNNVKHKRSRTPTPSSSVFGDVEHWDRFRHFENRPRSGGMNDAIQQHRQVARFNADFNQQVQRAHFDVDFNQHVQRAHFEADFNQQVQRAHFDADFNQQVQRGHRMIQQFK